MGLPHPLPPRGLHRIARRFRDPGESALQALRPCRLVSDE
jgi:hypothetical protein